MIRTRLWRKRPIIAAALVVIAGGCSSNGQATGSTATERPTPSTVAAPSDLQSAGASTALCAAAADPSSISSFHEQLREIGFVTDLDLSFALAEIVTAAEHECPALTDQLASLANDAYELIGPDLVAGTPTDGPLTPHGADQ
jgi:hypothetical protein